jgi:hypothetical protein
VLKKLHILRGEAALSENGVFACIPSGLCGQGSVVGATQASADLVERGAEAVCGPAAEPFCLDGLLKTQFHLVLRLQFKDWSLIS